ncbi:MAG: type III-B CRISPR module RAMP protein Cmr6, partial [Armatimonadota bacterium]
MPVDSLRLALPKPGEVRVVSNASLFFDRWLERQETGAGGSRAKDELLNKIVETSPSEVYRKAYERWKDLLGNQPNTAFAEMKVEGRLIVGLGGENVLEAGLTLHRIYGAPIIPGSALKGLSRHYAQQVLGSLQGCCELFADEGYQGEYHRILFGNTESAGYVNYLDAWYVPDSAPEDKPFVRDVITTHHPKYYQECSRWPWDFDDPNPVPFISVRGSFLVATSGPSKDWAEFALKLLQQALEDYGVGGKTSSGYGRLTVVEKVSAAEP